MTSQADKHITLLVIMRYSGWASPAGFFSMALFRIPLLFNKRINFWRLMGCGKNGTFDKIPDLQQWAMLGVLKPATATQLEPYAESDKVKLVFGRLIAAYLAFFGCNVHGIVLQPTEGHGLWNGKQVFGPVGRKSASEGPVAVLTRATIRLNRLHRFWAFVNPVASQMAEAKGFITSYGIGEIPYIKQATFSIWQNRELMKAFAYQMKEHREVVAKTYSERWYSEDMFMRFEVLYVFGDLPDALIPFAQQHAIPQ